MNNAKDALDAVAYVGVQLATLTHAAAEGTSPEHWRQAVTEARAAVSKLSAVIETLAAEGVN